MKKLLYILPIIFCFAFFATSCEDEALIEIEEQQEQKEDECTGSYCKLDTGIPSDIIAFLDFSNPSTF